MQPTYTYKKINGMTISCYGKLEETSNIEVVCDNEYGDTIITDNTKKTWAAVCAELEKNYRNDIVQLVAC